MKINRMGYGLFFGVIFCFTTNTCRAKMAVPNIVVAMAVGSICTQIPKIGGLATFIIGTALASYYLNFLDKQEELALQKQAHVSCGSALNKHLSIRHKV